MLDDIKSHLIESASLIDNYKKISKNDLANNYIKYEGTPLADSYLSAIILRYWNLINKYYSLSYKSTSIETCYDWLIDAILTAFHYRAWTDPEDKLYDDPNAFDKVINRCMQSQRIKWYEDSNRYRRKINYGIMTVDQELGDYLNTNTTIDEYNFEVFDESIKKLWKDKDYFKAFTAFCILYDDVYEDNKLKMKKLIKRLHYLDNNCFIREFMLKYNLSIDEVKKSIEYVKDIPSDKMEQKILQTLKELKHNYIIKGSIS